MAEQRLCERCRNGTPDGDWCNRFPGVQAIKDRRRPYDTPTSVARGSDGACGPDGKLWEVRPAPAERAPHGEDGGVP